MSDPIDPVRADEFSCIASDTDVVIVFSRKLFTRNERQFDSQPVVSAAVSVPWALAMQIRTAMDQMEQQRRMQPQAPQRPADQNTI